jgi:hypothetical protein
MTRASLLWGIVAAACCLPGCGQTRTALPPPPPHGGTAFPLPDGKGFVEVIRHDNPDQPGQTQLVIYFMNPECKPMPSAPTNVSFQPRGKNAARIAFKLAADSDPATAGGLASATFADAGDIAGQITATIDSKPVSILINVR